MAFLKHSPDMWGGFELKYDRCAARFRILI